jgi:tetratricopeptide (TPR) repeat protein
VNVLVGILLICAALPAVAQPIDQVPMYGGMDRSAYPDLKAADETFIAGVTKEFGSREAAAKVFVSGAFRYYDEDKLDLAMRRFNQAWLLDPNNPEVYWGFGVVLHDRAKMCEGKAMIDRALSFKQYITGLLPDAGNIISLCAVDSPQLSDEDRRQQYERADALFREAAEKDRNKAYVYNNWARALYHREQYAEAWRMVAKAREQGGRVSEGLLRRLREKMPEPR